MPALNSSPPPTAGATRTEWGVVRLRVVTAFGVLALLVLAGYGTVTFALRSRGGEAALVPMLGELRHAAEHLRDAEVRALASWEPTRPWVDSIEFRVARLREARARLDDQALGAPAPIRSLLQEAGATASLLERFAQTGLASLARRDTASARAGQLASERAHEQLDLVLDRAVVRVVEVTGHHLVQARQLLFVLVVITLLALVLLATRSVLPAVRAARAALDDAARAREALAAQAFALQQARDLTRSVIESAADGIVAFDREQRFLLWNAQMARLYGLHADAVLGRSLAECLPGVAAGEVGAAYAAAIAGEVVVVRNREMVATDGSSLLIDATYRPLFDASGHVVGGMGKLHDVTAERTQARQLQAERAFSASLIDANSDGVFALDDTLCITEWNAVMALWSGIDRAAALGRSIDSVIPLESPAHDARRAERFRAMLADGTPFRQERTYRFPSRQRVHTVETVVSPLRDRDDGRIIGALCTVRDIAERRAAEQRFRLLFQHSAVGHLLLSDTRIVDCNDAALRMLGHDDRQHFLSLAIDELSPEYQPDGSSSAEHRRALHLRATHEGPQRFDWSYRRRDGSELLVEATLSAVPLPQGPGLLLVWHDITARLAVEAAVRRERERLSDAIEALEAGFAMFDAQQRLVAFNRTFAAMRPPYAAIAVGDTLRHMLERILIDGRHPVTGAAGEAWIAAAEARHAGAGETFEEQLADRVVRVSVTRTRDGGSVALMNDISELVWIQHSLEDARDAERHANQAKSAFLASMSHELRTPLNSIIGFTAQVRKNKGGHLTATDQLYLERVERNAIQLLALINSLLDLSRIEAGRLEVDLAPTELASLLRDTVAQLEGQARPGVVVRVDAPDEAPLLEIDAGKVRQVVINLLGNALKFTHDGSVTVRLHLAESGDPAVIEVEDTGIGIPDDRLDAIFQPFEQAERTTARDYGGTGLGLNISRSLCALIGARLEVRSTVGIGTTFRVVLGTPPSEPPALPSLAEPVLTTL